MHSLRTKITAMTVCVIVISMVIAMALGVNAIRNTGSRSANQILLLLCETGQKNLNHYIDSVEQSVEIVSTYVQADLDGVDDKKLQEHMDRVRVFLEKLTHKTQGVLTYYYRVDPALSRNVKGFWFVNLDGTGFKEHEVTDISLYDTSDTSKLVWFTVPKATGKGVWLPPYVTDNLDVRVISYNVPVYYKKQFVGVIGIEIDESTVANVVKNITLFDNGYAFVNDAAGNIVYHPHMDVATMKVQPKVPAGLLSKDKFIRYEFEGFEKQAVWLTLNNGMRLNVTVPVKEINADWQNWSRTIMLAFAVLLVVFIGFIMAFVGRITKPLRKLTVAAEQVAEGNYDFELDYDGQDEVGILTRTFKTVTARLKTYISDLSDLAYADALTSVHNKGAFDISVRKLQAKLDETSGNTEFAVCMFDCNRLKQVNDRYGHDKGDIYLKESAAIVCKVFSHSPVFRIGGDEFAALLMGNDYQNREALIQLFDKACSEKRSHETAAWEKVDVARGMAVYTREDSSVNDVVRRADRIMYENKWHSKNSRQA